MSASASPLVSVIVPTHNRARLAGRAISSVLAQDVESLEVILVDDGSKEPLAELSVLQDPRVHLFRSPARKGAPAARNRGIDEARGDYLAFLDSDDFWLPGTIRKLLAPFRTTTGLGGVVGGGWTVTNRGAWCSSTRMEGRIAEEVLRFHPALLGVTSRMVVSRAVTDGGLRWSAALPAYQDWDFLLRAADVFDFSVVPDLVAVIDRTHMRDHVYAGPRILEGLLAVGRIHSDRFSSDQKAAVNYRVRLANAYLDGDDLESWRAQLRPLLRDPSVAPRTRFWSIAARLGVPSYRWAVRLMPPRGARVWRWACLGRGRPPRMPDDLPAGE